MSTSALRCERCHRKIASGPVLDRCRCRKLREAWDAQQRKRVEKIAKRVKKECPDNEYPR